jgi:uncharacterized membrane protein
MVFSRFIFWLWFTGLIFLFAGLFAVRRELTAARGLDKLLVLGPIFVAASLALFGAEHLAGAQFVMQAVPPWMPGPLFWTYFVGVALIAAATSIIKGKQVRLSATLLGIMIFLFVVMIHVPNVVKNPGDRIRWAVALRDLAFAGGAWALAGGGSRWSIIVGRVCIGIPLVFFAVEHFLHPEFVPGVPLEKLTPAWIPVRAAWGYLTGAFLLVSGVSLLANRWARTALTWLGVEITLLVLLIYLPIVVAANQPQMIEALNYIADTLLFGGIILVMARSITPSAAR